MTIWSAVLIMIGFYIGGNMIGDAIKEGLIEAARIMKGKP